MPRKQYNLMLRALVPVLERNPTVDVVLHCRVHDQGGFMLDTLSKFSVAFRQRVMLTMAHDTYQGLSREELNEVVTRTMLLEKVWDFHFDPKTNIVETHISRLRSKIDKGFGRPLLHTVRGAGYVIRD